MLSAHLPPYVGQALKALAALVAVLAAIAGWRAARLWLQASRVQIPEYTEPETSASDVPELHIYTALGAVSDIHLAHRVSGQLNARAAVWTGWAAALTGLAAILSAV